MPRPSQRIDEALLRSGSALYPAAGAAGLTVRAVCEHAGTQPGMFHYHFRSKEAFLRALLQRMYEEMYAGLEQAQQPGGSAIERLRRTLAAMARSVRDHRRTIARLWADAMAGDAVARDFLSQNAPRHVGLLVGLLAEAGGPRAGGPAPLQAFAFLMGGVVMPMVFVAGLADAGVALPVPRPAFDAQVMSDAAIDARIELALAALQAAGAR